MDTKLTPHEHRLLLSCEQTIEGRLHKFYEVGKALLIIRKLKLYRQTHSTFEQYCKERWHFTARHARHHIGAWETYEVLQQTATAPVNESQLRSLQTLPPEQRQMAWEEALRYAGGPDEVTAKHVTAAVQALRRPSHQKTIKITLRLCEVCDYSFSDEHHLKPQSSGGRRFGKISLCPNHHRYATILQHQMFESHPRAEIEAFAARHFDSTFNRKVLPSFLDRTYEISKGISEALDLFNNIP